MKKDNIRALLFALPTLLMAVLFGMVCRECKNLWAEREKIQAERELLWVPPGHFYSPIPSLEDRDRAVLLFASCPKEIPGIDLNTARQLELLGEFRKFYAEMPFSGAKKPGLRYSFENPNFGHGDGIGLYSMIRYLKPQRIIEIGSGYSSCAILDINERFFNNTIKCTFIEPYPELLLSLTSEKDRERFQLIPSKLQELDVAKFKELKANDILFIDSTHVAKAGSDVNYTFSTILPALADGVYIHIHDVFYPFEYPPEWAREGRAWNELYMLRAFLQYNQRFQIEFFNSYLSRTQPELLAEAWPLSKAGPGGSIWLKKVSR